MRFIWVSILFFYLIVMLPPLQALEMDVDFFSVIQKVESKNKEFFTDIVKAKQESGTIQSILVQSKGEFFEAESENDELKLEKAKMKIVNCYMEKILLWGNALEKGLKNVKTSIKELEKVRGRILFTHRENKQEKVKEKVLFESIEEFFSQIEKENEGDNIIAGEYMSFALTRISHLQRLNKKSDLAQIEENFRREVGVLVDIYLDNLYLILEKYSAISIKVKKMARLTKMAAQQNIFYLIIMRPPVKNHRLLEV